MPDLPCTEEHLPIPLASGASAMSSPSRHSSPPSSPRANPLRVGLLCAFLAATPALGHADQGRWTALRDLNPDPQVTNDLAIHLTLLRGDAAHHSRVLWWGHQGAVGGVRGWDPGNDDCAVDPLSTLPSVGSWSPNADIFCGGMCTLSSGEFLSIGGTDKNSYWGIRDARTYSVATGLWTPRALMNYSRFYPTATLLKDGRALTSWGQRYGHLWLFGGRRDGAPPASGNGDLLFRTGRGTNPVWDSALTPDSTGSNERPTPREGQSASSLTYNSLPGMAIFGGRDGNGNTDDKVTWHLHREDGGVLDADYKYKWDKVNVFVPFSAGRAEHIAASLSSNEMVIFGGVSKPSGGSPVLLDELWHLWRNTGTGQWTWWLVQPTGTPPTPRYGHAAVYVNDGVAMTRKLYVYGGSEQWNQPPVDSKLYVFTFTHGANSPATGTWTTVNLTGGPGARRGHTLVYDATGPTGPALLLYGGYLNGAGGDSTLWKLDLGTMTWSSIATSGASPGARAGHAAYYEDQNVFNGGRMTLFGGDPVGGGSSDAYAYTIEPFAPGGAVWVRGAAETARLSGHTMIQDPGSQWAFSRRSEVYDPSADSWTDTQAGHFRRKRVPIPSILWFRGPLRSGAEEYLKSAQIRSRGSSISIQTGMPHSGGKH